MKEIFRIATSSPFSNFQETTEDVDFHGYGIPKSTIVIGNIFGQHYNDKIWDAPEEFRPERFMDEFNNSPSIISFSVGLRTCIGQTFARNVFFLLLVFLYQRFSFELDVASNPIPTDE
jgi:cytochrome P450